LKEKKKVGDVWFVDRFSSNLGLRKLGGMAWGVLDLATPFLK